jgi:spore coat polysaccharide biosynthesis protein SpsF
MLDIERGVTVLDHMIALLATEPSIAEIVLAVSEGAENEPFQQMAKSHGLRSIRGDERDVLGRHLQTAEISGATDIFIVTTESPFTYFEGIAEAWRAHCESGNDVTATEGLPIGSAFGIFGVATLRRSHDRGDNRHRSEFISLYVREHPEEFRIQVLEAPDEVRRLDVRLTIDYPEDLVLCRQVYGHLRELAPRIPVSRIIRFLDERPELAALVKPYVVAERLYEQGGTR